MLHAPSAADGTPQGRWETYKRIKANRQVMHSLFPVLNLICMCFSLLAFYLLPFVSSFFVEIKVDKFPKKQETHDKKRDCQ